MANRYMSYEMGSGITNILLQSPKNMPAYQYLREMIVNSAEAGAKNVWIEPWTDPATGEQFTMIRDDGPGMTEAQVHSYLYRLFESGKGTDNNFGWGGRVSTLGLNEAGVLYATRAADGERMVKLTPQGVYRWDTDAGLEDMVEPDEGLLPATGTGVSVVLLGKTGKKGTWDDSRGYEMSRWIKGRFFTYPSEITVRYYEAAQNSGDGGYRIVRPGIDSWDACEESGTIEFVADDLKGTMWWALLPTVVSQSDRTTPGVGILHEGEVFDLSTGYMDWFGIPYSRAKQRVQILIEIEGSSMNIERSRANPPGYQHYPYKALGRVFDENMPEPIRALLANHTGITSGLTDEMAKRLNPDWMKSLEAVSVWRPSVTGPKMAGQGVGNVLPGRNGDPGNPGDGSRRRAAAQRNAAGDKPAVERNEKVLPRVEWVASADLEDTTYGIKFVAATNTIMVADDIGPVVRTTRLMQSRTTLPDLVVRDAVRSAYEIELAAAALDALGANRWRRITTGDTSALLSEEALFMKLLGEQSIVDLANANLKKVLREAA